MTARQTSSLYADLSPSLFGLPDKFEAFRTAQAQALEWATYDCKKKFTACCLPTGEGKSLFGAALARVLGVKAVYLTATRNLQDQVWHDGLVDADSRGRSNYKCSQRWPGRKFSSCEYGHGHGCCLEHTPGCGHDNAMLKAAGADLTVTNYSNWMYKRKYNKKAFESEDRPVELLICDEAGEVPEQISSFVAIEIKHDDEELPISIARGEEKPSGLMPESTWVTWSRERGKQAVSDMERIAAGYRTKAEATKDDRYQYLTELRGLCDRIPTLDSNWVWEVDQRGVKFQPIWPGQLASALWSGVPRVVLMSATLRPYTMQLCGIKEFDYDYREWPSSFLPQHNPFYYHSAGVKLTWRSDQEAYRKVFALADEWLDKRADRRTIIHTGSYPRARMIQSMSRHAGRMIFNESGRDAQEKHKEFVSGADNGILVGPSYTTGSNFPGRDAEFQIIIKTPFPDTSSRVMKERCENSDYRMHVTVDKLVQIRGRLKRSQSDRGETVILDDGVRWCMGGQQWHGHAPKDFRCQQVDTVPPAPPRVSK